MYEQGKTAHTGFGSMQDFRHPWAGGRSWNVSPVGKGGPLYTAVVGLRKRLTWIRDVEQFAGIRILPVLHRHTTAMSTYYELHKDTERCVGINISY